MNAVIIGCKTVENELNSAIKQSGVSYDVKWIESGLHNYPSKLNIALQEAIDESKHYSRALIAMGYCGNSLAGLKSNSLTMVIPRVDDCISLLLGSYQNRLAASKGDCMYFMTDGWLKGERNIWHEYLYTIDKYGEEMGKQIFNMILGNYKSLALLDTGCYDIGSIEDEVRKIASTLNLDYKVIPGTVRYLSKLLTGPWTSDEFLVIPPHCEIMDSDLVLANT